MSFPSDTPRKTTIADLGLDASDAYAKRTEGDTSFFQDAPKVSSEAHIASGTRVFQPELSSFLLSLNPESNPDTHTGQSHFPPPPGHSSMSRSLFTNPLMIASLGSEEKQSALLAKMQALAEKTKNPSETSSLKTIINLLVLLGQFNHLLVDFYSKRAQDQRG